MEGKIKFYSEKKGFGFITNSESGKDIFFHHTGLLDKITSGDVVKYELGETDRGSKAINIIRIKKDA